MLWHCTDWRLVRAIRHLSKNLDTLTRFSRPPDPPRNTVKLWHTFASGARRTIRTPIPFRVHSPLRATVPRFVVFLTKPCSSSFVSSSCRPRRSSRDFRSQVQSLINRHHLMAAEAGPPFSYVERGRLQRRLSDRKTQSLCLHAAKTARCRLRQAEAPAAARGGRGRPVGIASCRKKRCRACKGWSGKGQVKGARGEAPFAAPTHQLELQIGRCLSPHHPPSRPPSLSGWSGSRRAATREETGGRK